MEEVQDDDVETVNCLLDFLTLNLISKDTALYSMMDKPSIYLKGKLDVKVVRVSRFWVTSSICCQPGLQCTAPAATLSCILEQMGSWNSNRHFPVVNLGRC